MFADNSVFYSHIAIYLFLNYGQNQVKSPVFMLETIYVFLPIKNIYYFFYKKIIYIKSP